MEVRYIVGQFGGFSLRLSWLPRLVLRYGVVGVPSNLEQIACELGVGKNMAKSMRAWGRAAALIGDDGKVSDMARYLFDSHDPYLERGESVALLHWLIASNVRGYTAAAWAFNLARSGSFTMQDAVSDFRNHLKSKGSTYAAGTLRGDVEPVLRMHAGWGDAPLDEIDDRFFSQLRLLTASRADRRTVYSRTWMPRRLHVSDGLLLYTLLQSLARRGTASATLSSLHSGEGNQASPGVVFGLTRDGFWEAAERLDRDKKSGLSLSTMPGEEALLSATGDLGAACARSDLSLLDARFFGATSGLMPCG